MCTDVSDKPAAPMIRVDKIVYPTLMMKAAGFSETSVHIYDTAWRYIAEDGDGLILIGPT